MTNAINTAPTALFKSIAHQLPSGKPVEAQAADPLRMAQTSQGVAQELLRRAAQSPAGGVPQLLPPQRDTLSDQELAALQTQVSPSVAGTSLQPGQQALREMQGLVSEVADDLLRQAPTPEQQEALLLQILHAATGAQDASRAAGTPRGAEGQDPTANAAEAAAEKMAREFVENMGVSDERFKMLVALMTMLMLMAQHDRNLSSELINMAEQAVAAAGERGVDAAKTRFMGAIVSFAAATVMSVASVAMAYSSAKANITDTKSNAPNTIKASDAGAKQQAHVAAGAGKAPQGGAASRDQNVTLEGNLDNSHVGQQQAKTTETRSNASVLQAGGYSLSSMAHPMSGLISGVAEVDASQDEAAKLRWQNYASTSQDLAAQENKQASEERDQMQRFMQILESLRQQRAEVLGEITRRLG